MEDCWRVAGSEGYVLKVRVPDIQALEATIGALNRIRGVARTRVPLEWIEVSGIDTVREEDVAAARALES